MAPLNSRLAVDISGSSIRVLEGAMGGPMRCGSAAVLDGSLRLGKISDATAVARVLQQLLARAEVTQTRALVAAGDSVATFRILHPALGSTPRDVDALVARELAFDPERMATRWVDLPSPNGRRAIYATAWDRTLVKNIIETVRMAGLELAVLELKSSSLARTLPVASGVLVDLVSDPAEIVLVDEHLPQVWHGFSLSQPLGDNPASALATPLRTVLRFYRRRGNGPFDSSHPVLIVAEQVLAASAIQELSGLVEQPVQTFPAPPRVPQNVRHETYLACVGLIMRRTG